MEHDAPIADHQPADVSPLQIFLNREASLLVRLDAEKAKAPADRNEDDIADLRAELATARQDRIAATEAAREDRIVQQAQAYDIRMAELANERLRLEVAAGAALDDVAQERRGFERRNAAPRWGMFCPNAFVPNMISAF